MQAKGDPSELIAKKSELNQQKTDLQGEVDSRRVSLEKKANSVGNIVHPSVPISQNEVQFQFDWTDIRTITNFSRDGILQANLLLNATISSLITKSFTE